MEGDPHKPLRDDVRLLGELRRHAAAACGQAIFHAVERVRALAKSARAGHDDDFRALADELANMSLDDAVPISRAFAHFLHLANVAEQHHRIRRRRVSARPAGATAGGLVRRGIRAAAGVRAVRRSAA